MGLGRERSCSGGVHGARGRGLALVGYMGLGGEVLLWWGTWG